MAKIFLFLSLSFVAFSCQNEVKFPIPFERKMVVHGLIRPNNIIFNSDSILISIGTNIPVTSLDANSEIKEAVVNLENNQKQILLPLLTKNATDLKNNTRRYGVASKNFPIIPGQNYSLSITTPSGFKSKATCKVPLKSVPTEKIKVEILQKDANRIRCKINWEDIPDEVNFYNVSIVLNLIDKNNKRSQPSQIIFKNELDAKKSIFTTEELIFQNLPEFDLDRSSIYVAVANIEESHYNWGKKQIAQQRQNDSNLFPEPVLIQGNVTDNIGLFSGYNATYIINNL